MNRLTKHGLQALICACIIIQLSGCSTNFRQGLQNLENHNSPQALEFFERDAKLGYRIPAIFASLLYTNDFKIPRDLEKSKYYLDIAIKSEYGRYDQAYDYYIPLIKAGQILDDDKQRDKSLAFEILKYEKYQEHSWPLSLRATCHLVGHGVEKDINKGKDLFERALSHRVWGSGGIYYAWWLSIYPEQTFRDPERALSFALDAMEDDDISDQSVPLNNLAAAYAINDQFNKAVEVQQQAIDKLNADIQRWPYLKKFEPAFNARLKNYQNKTAWTLSHEDLSRCGLDSIECIRSN